MVEDILDAERQYLSHLLEAIQRCVYFLHASDRKIDWPLEGGMLAARRKDAELFESLSAINERFAKLQDTLGAAMRHASMLMGEQTDNFLKVLAFHEKIGVIDSVSSWQLCRTARNLAAHDYEIEYADIADHFNTFHAPVGAPPPARIAANPHPNLPPQAGEGAIVSPPARGRGLRGGLAALLQSCFGPNG